jgi:hypothetical protein
MPPHLGVVSQEIRVQVSKSVKSTAPFCRFQLLISSRRRLELFLEECREIAPSASARN